MELGGYPYSIEQYQAISNIEKSTLSKKRKKWINESNPTKLFNVKDDQLLLEYATDRGRYNVGERSPKCLFDTTGKGQMKSEQAQLIRHITFTNPGIKTSKFPELYTAFFVLITGHAPTKEEVPSPEAVRINMERLNKIDKYFIGQMFADIAKEPSPCDNLRFFSSVGDGSKQGTRKKTHVYQLTCERVVEDRKSLDLNERYQVKPCFILGTTAPSVQHDAESNSKHNIEVLRKMVPPEALGHYNGLGCTENADSAKKEVRLDFEKTMQLLDYERLQEYTRLNGVDRLHVWCGDGFHIEALIDKHMSIGCCGDTVNGKHEHTYLNCCNPITVHSSQLGYRRQRLACE
jgi:hypothetical protein